MTLALAMGAGAIPLFGVAALAPAVVADLGLTRTQLGFASTVSFVLAAAWSGVAGSIIDRVGARRAMILLFVVAAAVIMLLTGATSYPWLLGVAAAAAFAQSLSNPVTNHVIARDVPVGERGTLMGVKQSGVQIVQLVTGAVLPATALLVGWRMAVGGMVLLPLLSLVLVVVFVGRDPARTVSGQPRQRVDTAWTAPLAVYAFLVGAALQATNVYTPLYTFEVVGASAAVAGATSAVIGGFGVVGRIVLGRIADRADRPESLLPILTVGAAIALGLIAAAPAGGFALLWVGLVLHAGTAVASNVAVMVTVIRLAPREGVGAASARVALGMYLGFALGPLAFGAIVDGTTSYLVAWGVLGVTYLIAGGATLGGLRRLRRSPLTV